MLMARKIFFAAVSRISEFLYGPALRLSIVSGNAALEFIKQRAASGLGDYALVPRLQLLFLCRLTARVIRRHIASAAATCLPSARHSRYRPTHGRRCAADYSY